ncbi:hypothetical protein C6P61_09690 [Malikia spinosa]|uniref:Uncharacterized protein n=1 Tax=Malikia spinosa TaxID=86180 RepID=A0A2S9KE95_9BURK|nr:hypothetical protein [Malikia spinosa]PRD68763.1 hypothetical protein C6P61_09690 [Malikia spinosa]
MLKSMRAVDLLADELPDRHALKIQIDTDQALADLDLLAKTAARSPQLRQRLLDLGDLGAYLRFAQVELAAAEPARQLLYRLELCGRLDDLVLAVRAGSVR